MSEQKVPMFYDGSPLAEAEVEMMNLLNEEQCYAISAWLKLYGHEFAKATPRCSRTLETNFRHAANRLEILGERGLPEREESSR